MIIENSKTYNATDVENIFFRPTFCGKSAEELGIRVLYNMPTPTKVPLFRHKSDIIKSFSSGWQGGTSADLQEQEVYLSKLKAESAYSAENYFSTIYELLTNSAEVNMSDLSGSDLEKAETELFRRALAESVYVNTWFGDEDGEVSTYNAFNGFIRNIINLKAEFSDMALTIHSDEVENPADEILREAWFSASNDLRALASDGNLAYFVSSDIYDAYQFQLDDSHSSAAYTDSINGRPMLSYHGIPLIEVPTHKYKLMQAKSFCILTDRRNLVLALNTADSPEKEIRMWYNPDEMENRQRVVFLAGTLVADKDIVAGAIFHSGIVF